MLSNGIHIGARRGVALGGGGGLTYLLRDDFTTDEAAPLASPRTAEPGPGTWNVVASPGYNVASIVSGRYRSGTVPHPNVNGLMMPATTTVPGLSILAKVSVAPLMGGVGFNSSTGLDTYGGYTGWQVGSGGFQGKDRGVFQSSPGYENLIPPLTIFGVILQQTFALFIGYTVDRWVLIRRGNSGAYPATLYPWIWVSNVVMNNLETVAVLPLGYPFDTDFGLATQRLAGVRAAGDTFTHTANCLIEWTQTTVPSSGQTEMRFRAQDANNYWQVTVDSTGALDLDEVVAGTPTQRGTAAGVVANGDRIVVIADGSTIRVYEANTLRITYASATNFATATAGELELLGTDGAVSDIVAWPRTLTGAAASILDAAVA